jgi:hypothetical protein
MVFSFFRSDLFRSGENGGCCVVFFVLVPSRKGFVLIRGRRSQPVRAGGTVSLALLRQDGIVLKSKSSYFVAISS